MLKSAMLKEQNRTYTENGALTNASTKSYVLDLFALGGSTKDTTTMVGLIQNALAEDMKLALKVIFYLSDIREGQGRRDLFRHSLLQVMSRDRELVRQLLPYIPAFGRWDYLYWFMDTPLEADALGLIKEEVRRSLNTDRPSLVFKWMASADASNQITRYNAEKTRKALKLTPRLYRKLLSMGRKLLKEAVVERQMGDNKWTEIDFSKVPSHAMKKYRKAFERHAPKEYQDFATKVSKGEIKVNSSVLYPHQILEVGAYSEGAAKEVLLGQWKNLPNYFGANVRALAVVDTSGSMTWGSNPEPLTVAAALGIMTSERMTGPFKDTVISFSRQAKYFDFSLFSSPFEKYRFLRRTTINENTNLQSVFDLILETAVKYRIPNHEMPNRILIMSDMEFDDTQRDKTNFEVIREEYELKGYEMPQIIFWNVDARNVQVAATKHQSGAILISGFSPAIMKTVLSEDPYITPYKAMLNTVNVERYDFINNL